MRQSRCCTPRNRRRTGHARARHARCLSIESMVEHNRITCPVTGRREDVELDRTPLGLVVTSCTGCRDDALACSRECARRMDRRDRADIDDRERVIVILASLRDNAAQVASVLAERLAEDCLDVEIAELGVRTAPPLEDYDAVVVGAEVRLGRHARAVIEYIREHREALAAIPAFFYSVGGRGVFDRDGYIQRMARRTGWHPPVAASFADASPVQRPGIRAFARQIADEIPARPQTSRL